MAHHDDRGVRIEFTVGTGGNFAHGNEDPAEDAGSLELPGFADIQQDWGFGL